MINYDKDEIRKQLQLEDIFQLLQEWGGDPEYTSFGIISATICHNPPGEGSRKLYFYSNSGLFHCYTGCPEGSFDVFQLVIKVSKIQWSQELDLNQAIRWIARRFGISGTTEEESKNEIEDWKLLANYDRIEEIKTNHKKPAVKLKEYDPSILDKFNYKIKLTPWLNEGISQESITKARIGYYPKEDQITIPHFDKDGRFIGLRGRTMCKAEAEIYGKYRPLRVNHQTYNHPLGLNVYGLNWNKDHIAAIGKVIILEGEKSVLQYGSMFGWDNNIAVACCGSNISNYQIQLLEESGAREIVIALDRQFQEIGDKEFKHLTKNLIKINDRYKNEVNISIMFDKNMITPYKASPTDCGKEKFLQLFKERIIL